MSTDTPSNGDAMTADGPAAPELSPGPVPVSTAGDPWAPTGEQPQIPQSAPQPPYTYPAASPTDPYASSAPTAGFSITSLVLGVASIFFGLTFVAPIAGLVFGVLGLRREPQGRTMAIWGVVLNAVCLLGAILLALFFIVLLIGLPLFGMGYDSSYDGYLS